VKPAVELLPALKSALGLADDVDDVGVIQAALTQFKAEGKKLREAVVDSVLMKRFKGGDEADRALVRRVIVGEMKDRDLKLTGDEEKDEKVVSEMITEIVDGDEHLKATVSEMEAAPPAIQSNGEERGNSTEAWKPGTSTSNVRVKSRA
jgi:hypothetical protein